MMLFMNGSEYKMNCLIFRPILNSEMTWQINTLRLLKNCAMRMKIGGQIFLCCLMNIVKYRLA